MGDLVEPPRECTQVGCLFAGRLVGCGLWVVGCD